MEFMKRKIKRFKFNNVNINYRRCYGREEENKA
jgi:hypothetical protein